MIFMGKGRMTTLKNIAKAGIIFMDFSPKAISLLTIYANIVMFAYKWG